MIGHRLEAAGVRSRHTTFCTEKVRQGIWNNRKESVCELSIYLALHLLLALQNRRTIQTVSNGCWADVLPVVVSDD